MMSVLAVSVKQSHTPHIHFQHKQIIIIRYINGTLNKLMIPTIYIDYKRNGIQGN